MADTFRLRFGANKQGREFYFVLLSCPAFERHGICKCRPVAGIPAFIYG